jgi:hypothetical protein
MFHLLLITAADANCGHNPASPARAAAKAWSHANLTLALAAILSGCTTTASPPERHASRAPPPSASRAAAAITAAPLTYTAEVRRLSRADDRLFTDMMHAMGGVDFRDRALFPQATQRALTGIEVVVPYDNRETGIERWTIQHDGEMTATYIVRFKPDGKGGTYFSVAKDVGSVTP